MSSVFVSPILDKIWEDLFASIGITKSEVENSITPAEFRNFGNEGHSKKQRFRLLGVEMFGDNYETTLNKLYENSLNPTTGNNFPLFWRKGGNISPNEFNTLPLDKKERIFINFTKHRGATNTVNNYWKLYSGAAIRIMEQQAVTDVQRDQDTPGDMVPPLDIVKSFLGGKKIRKHRGIHQIGGNAGKLKKGFKYSGKRLKNGKAEIVQVARKTKK